MGCLDYDFRNNVALLTNPIFYFHVLRFEYHNNIIMKMGKSAKIYSILYLFIDSNYLKITLIFAHFLKNIPREELCLKISQLLLWEYR